MPAVASGKVGSYLHMLLTLTPGRVTTIQDLGRHRTQRDGMPVAGALDSGSMRVANLLVGNAPADAVVELMLDGAVFDVIADGICAVTGGSATVDVDGRPIPLWRAFAVAGGSRLAISRKALPGAGPPRGAVTYLALAGGVDVPVVVGSRSTYLRAGIGGMRGRALVAGDVIPAIPMDPAGASRAQRCLAWSAGPELLAACGAEDRRESYSTGDEPFELATPIRVVATPETARFPTASVLSLVLEQGYVVGPSSDRMGYRLSGPSLTRPDDADTRLSEPVPLGAIQVPPDGQPVVLLADHQTIGGYPVIGVVAAVDIGRIAQVPPGGAVRFEWLALDVAQQLAVERERILRIAETRVRLG